MHEVYSAAEIARAAGADVADVRAVLGPAREFVPFADAVDAARRLTPSLVSAAPATPPAPLFAMVAARQSDGRSRRVPLAVSSGLHAAAVITAAFLATAGLAPDTASAVVAPAETMRLVFVATPGPGGGGGGGGLREPAPPPPAERKGHETLRSPVPIRRPPRPIVPRPQPPEPKPAVLDGERLPVVIAPIVAARADSQDRIGVLARSPAEAPSHGPGIGGGAGTGSGTGLGEGDGPGVGPGSGGGTGGGPYRPGSGIEPPRLLREVKADYTDDARRSGIEGEVGLEIVVLADGTVGSVRVVQGLDPGLDARAVNAVRQWRFAPATRHGAPVDVIVQVSVEFRLR
jgi:TonB family protein